MIVNWLKNNYITILICIFILLIISYYFNTKEGFQTQPELTDTPATCAVMNLILETSNKNLQAAISRGDTKENINNLQNSYDSILNEKNKMIC